MKLSEEQKERLVRCYESLLNAYAHIEDADDYLAEREDDFEEGYDEAEDENEAAEVFFRLCKEAVSLSDELHDVVRRAKGMYRTYLQDIAEE